MARPKKLTFPINLDTFLRLTFPKKRREDRWHLFRSWNKWNLCKLLDREPTEHESDDSFKKWNERQYYDSNKTWAIIDHLRLDYLPIYTKENRRARAANAGRESWSASARKKRAKKKSID